MLRLRWIHRRHGCVGARPWQRNIRRQSKPLSPAPTRPVGFDACRGGVAGAAARKEHVSTQAKFFVVGSGPKF